MNLLKCLLTIMALTSVNAFAEESNIKFGAKLWSQFMYDITTYPTPGTTTPSVTTANKLGLDIYRAYFTASYKFNEDWSSFLLLEGSRSSVVTTATTSENQVVHVRNMYVQNSKIFGEATLRVGYMPTPYTFILDGYTKARWLATNLNDTAAGNVTPPGGAVKTIGFTPTHAGGAQLSGDFFDKTLKYTLMIHNGVEGLTLAGNNDTGLSYLALVDIMPFKNWDNDLKNLGIIISNDYMSPARLANSTSSTPAAATNVSEGANLTELALHYQSSFFDGAIEYGMQSEPVIYGVTSPDSSSTGWGITGT
ncbi:MAG: hypothetical protein IPM57_10525, partial [Oligoflexia bacterium]|nr:hypothetical protein [Oligoflexia bacterium]